jgi:hypothetical protein
MRTNVGANWHVDFSRIVGDNFLEQLGLVKGSRKVVDHEERGRVLEPWMGITISLLMEDHCLTHLLH